MGAPLVRQKNRASQKQAQLASLSDIKFQGVKDFSRLKAIKTKMQTSEAFAFWRGRAPERMSFRACAEAKDVELARTSGAYAPFRAPIARVSAQYKRVPALLFAYFFWSSRKSMPPEATAVAILQKRSLQRETLNMRRALRAQTPAPFGRKNAAPVVRHFVLCSLCFKLKPLLQPSSA